MTSSAGSGEVRLATPLGSWEVFLEGGGVLFLAAHAYSRELDEYVFVALAEGSSCYEVEIARIPALLVAKICGG
jgi:hypothetical protein